jgi:hypothetical protein
MARRPDGFDQRAAAACDRRVHRALDAVDGAVIGAGSRRGLRAPTDRDRSREGDGAGQGRDPHAGVIGTSRRRLRDGLVRLGFFPIPSTIPATSLAT